MYFAMERAMVHTGFSDIAAEMQAQTAEFKTKADKIRALAKAGYTRQQIADFLGIRYQHVRNVLVDDERKAKALLGPPPPDWPADLETKSAGPPGDQPAKEPRRTVKVKLGPGNQLAIPPHMLDALGWKAGDTIWVNLEGNGEIRLADAGAVTRHIQAWVRSLVPEGESLMDDLHEERQLWLKREEELCRR
jgi:antitoxin component of MazEF toxin-antitoxin module